MVARLSPDRSLPATKEQIKPPPAVLDVTTTTSGTRQTSTHQSWSIDWFEPLEISSILLEGSTFSNLFGSALFLPQSRFAAK
jgi:hypothetical protein